MSGDLTSTPGRFIASNRKFSGSMNPGPPQGTRGTHARSKLLTSKVSAPRPINLPSLRRENASGAESSTSASSSPAIQSTGWGSPASSPFASPQQQFKQAAVSDNKSAPAATTTAGTSEHTSPVLTKATTSTVASAASSKAASDAFPKSPVSSPQQPRAWSTVSNTSKPISMPSSADFPATSETTHPTADPTKESNEDSKKETNKDEEKDQSTEPNAAQTGNLDWDEIVRQDLESQTSQAGSFDRATSPVEIVSPEDRFTEDYDRSYPPQIRQTKESDQRQAPVRNVWRNSSADNSQGSTQKWHHFERYSGSERRRSSDRSNRNAGHPHRDFADTDRRRLRNHYDRRPSQERRSSFQPTVILQSTRHMKEAPASQPDDSDSGSPINRPTEITTAQREVMLTAAERAKKRRDEEEAEYEAARERARKKAEALAAAMTEKKSPDSSFKAEATAEKPATQNGTLTEENAKSPVSKDAKASEESKTDAAEDVSKERVSKEETTKDQASPSRPSWDKKKASTESIKASEPTSKEVEKNSKAKLDEESEKSTTIHEEKKKEIRHAEDLQDIIDESRQENEDERRWAEYVNDVRDNKDSQQQGTGGASAWAAYASRLQSQEAARWTSQIRRYAAERNKDPEFYEDLRPNYLHQPLSRPTRSTQRKDDNRGRQRRDDNRAGTRRRDSKNTADKQSSISEVEKAASTQEPVDQKESTTTDSDLSIKETAETMKTPEAGNKEVPSEAPRTEKKEAPSEEDVEPSTVTEKVQESVPAEETKPSTVSESKEQDKDTQIEQAVPPVENEVRCQVPVQKYWTRSERQDFIQKQSSPIFPYSLVIPSKPDLLAFTFTATEESTSLDGVSETISSVTVTQEAALKDDGWGPPPSNESIAKDDAWGSEAAKLTEEKATNADTWEAPSTQEAATSNDGWGESPTTVKEDGWGPAPSQQTQENNTWTWSSKETRDKSRDKPVENGWGHPPARMAPMMWPYRPAFAPGVVPQMPGFVAPKSKMRGEKAQVERRDSKQLSPEAKPFTPTSPEAVTPPPKDTNQANTKRKHQTSPFPPLPPWNSAYPMLVYAVPMPPGATKDAGKPNGMKMQGIPGFTAPPNNRNLNFYFVPAPPPPSWYRKP